MLGRRPQKALSCPSLTAAEVQGYCSIYSQKSHPSRDNESKAYLAFKFSVHNRDPEFKDLDIVIAIRIEKALQK